MKVIQKLRRCMAWHGEAGPGAARQSEAKQGEVTSIIQRVDCWMHWRKLQRGAAGRGMALLGRAGRGLAWIGKDKQGKVDSKHPAISVVG